MHGPTSSTAPHTAHTHNGFQQPPRSISPWSRSTYLWLGHRQTACRQSGCSAETGAKEGSHGLLAAAPAKAVAVVRSLDWPSLVLEARTPAGPAPLQATSEAHGPSQQA